MKPIIHLDASLLKQNSCIRRIALRSFDQWTKADQSMTKAEYGTAFHKALAIWYRDPNDLELAIKTAIDHYTPFELQTADNDFRTCLHLDLSLRAYFKHYEHDSLSPYPTSNAVDGKPQKLIEVKFSWPAFSTDTHEFVYSGTIDMVADYAGVKCLVDHKTTALSQRALFFEKFNFDVQPMFYAYMYRMISGENFYRPFIVNGIFIKQVTKKSKTFDGVDFERSQLIEYSDEQMTIFEDWLKAICWRLQNTSPNVLRNCYDFASCQQTWGLCEFFSVCSAPNKQTQDQILNTKFKRAYYDPTKFQE